MSFEKSCFDLIDALNTRNISKINKLLALVVEDFMISTGIAVDGQ